MSIITDALKKAQKERVSTISRQPSLPVSAGTQGTSVVRAAGKHAKSRNFTTVIAAGASFAVIIVSITLVFFSASTEKVSSETPKLSVAPKANMERKAAEASPILKIEPFQVSFPRISKTPVIKVKPAPEVSGIMYLPTSPQAILNGRTVKEGDIVDGYAVIRIYPESVKVSSDGVETELKLR